MTTVFGRYILVITIFLCLGYHSFGQRVQRMQNFRREPNFNRPNGQFSRPPIVVPYNQPSFRAVQPRVSPVQQLKENFVNKRLGLTPEQSQRFAPLYHQYQQEIINVRKLKRLNNSDAQANGADQINKDLFYQQQLVEINQRYTGEFLKILPPEKVSMILKAEREFNDELTRQLNERAANGPSAAQPPNE